MKFKVSSGSASTTAGNKILKSLQTTSKTLNYFFRHDKSKLEEKKTLLRASFAANNKVFLNTGLHLELNPVPSLKLKIPITGNFPQFSTIIPTINKGLTQKIFFNTVFLIIFNQ